MLLESRSTLAQAKAAVGSRLHRWRTLIGEAWRFGIVGIANVLINFVVFNALALTLFPSGELKANVVATAVATTTSYLMNRGWTFRHRKTSRIPREYVLFFAFNAAGLAIELAVMGLAKYGLGLTTLLALNLAKAAGLGLGTIFRFWTYRTFVFAGRPEPVVEPMPELVARADEAPTTPHTRRSHGAATGATAGPVAPGPRGGELATAPAGTSPGP